MSERAKRASSKRPPDQPNTREDWVRYERLKGRLSARDMAPEHYEQRLMQLARRLGL